MKLSTCSGRHVSVLSRVANPVQNVPDPGGIKNGFDLDPEYDMVLKSILPATFKGCCPIVYYFTLKDKSRGFGSRYGSESEKILILNA
jgi:hypothetical protein